jgi:HEAT repeat protein
MIGNERAIPALTESLNDRDAGVRAAAQEALNSITGIKIKNAAAQPIQNPQ